MFKVIFKDNWDFESELWCELTPDDLTLAECEEVIAEEKARDKTWGYENKYTYAIVVAGVE